MKYKNAFDILPDDLVKEIHVTVPMKMEKRKGG